MAFDKLVIDKVHFFSLILPAKIPHILNISTWDKFSIFTFELRFTKEIEIYSYLLLLL